MDPLIFEKFGSCDVGVHFDRNHLILYNCTSEMVDLSDCRIIMRNCTTCVEVYIVGKLYVPQIFAPITVNCTYY